MFDGDFGDLDLGSRRKPTVWVATAPPLPTTKPPKRGGGRCRKKGWSKVERRDSSSSDDLEMKRKVKEENTRREPGVLHLEPEVEHGWKEYKQRLKEPNPIRFQQLVTQMQFRLTEGCGSCEYYIGVQDDGYCLGLTPEHLEGSLSVARQMAKSLKATTKVKEYLPGSSGKKCAIVEVKREVNDNITAVDLRIAVAGTIDSGKSTLIAVLTHGSGGRPLLDNGLGSARTNVLKHKHEIESGRTSSINEELLGYDEEGRVLNYAGVSAFTPAEIGTAASRQIHFIDMGGHEKYLKTAFYGLTSMLPDYVVLCISTVSGIGKVTREHLAVALALDIPVAVVFTKIDVASPAQVQNVQSKLTELIRGADVALMKRVGVEWTEEQSVIEVVATETDAERFADIISGTRQQAGDVFEHYVPLSIPIFPVSNFTGSGLHLLHAFLRGLQPMPIQRADSFSQSLSDEGSTELESDGLSHFAVDHTFELESVGMVVSGTAVDGSITIGQELNLGPDNDGKFTPVLIESIQRCQVPVKMVKAGQTATLAINVKSSSTSQSECEQELLSEELSLGNMAPEADPAVQQSAPPSTKKSQDSNDTKNSTDNNDQGFRIRPHSSTQSEVDGKCLGMSMSSQRGCPIPAPPSPTTSSLKGTVLLDSALSMVTVWEFDAVMVLLGGHWPARGLLSGKWPPVDENCDSGSDSQSGGGGSFQDLRGLAPPSRKSSKKKPMFTTTIHMGSIRQSASVVCMEEILDEKCKGCGALSLLPASLSAATAVITAVQTEEVEEGVPWCVARVRFRFSKRPEWVQEGLRFVVRDRSEGGNLSGVGVVERTVLAEE
ncbi:hypothetical protein BSKO_06214 [Bryopsis sp. KO-2023]|nr:hypothetical protein BSKO_06214 [Bryopsis sp. KO-2023]